MAVPDSSAPTATAQQQPTPDMTTTTTTKVSPAATTEPTTTTTTTTAMGNAGIAGAGNVNPATKKRCWWRRTVHFTVFLAVFSTVLSLLWIYTITAEIRRKAFDMNMMRDYVLDHISMDNPDLVTYIRAVQLKAPMQKDVLNATETPEEQFVAAQLSNKRDGIYFEYMSRVGATTTTAWLEKQLNWRGLLVSTDLKTFYEAHKSTRNLKTKVLHACLSTDKDTREIAYHQDVDVQVTKLDGGPNSLGLATSPALRLMCFPLYSMLLAYNSTTIDYLNLDSSEVQDGLVLNTIPWDKIRISVLAIHWNDVHKSEPETREIIDKLARHNYKYIKSLSTGKLIFVYNQQLKV